MKVAPYLANAVQLPDFSSQVGAIIAHTLSSAGQSGQLTPPEDAFLLRRADSAVWMLSTAPAEAARKDDVGRKRESRHGTVAHVAGASSAGKGEGSGRT